MARVERRGNVVVAPVSKYLEVWWEALMMARRASRNMQTVKVPQNADSVVKLLTRLWKEERVSSFPQKKGEELGPAKGVPEPGCRVVGNAHALSRNRDGLRATSASTPLS